MYTLSHVHPFLLPFLTLTHAESRKREGVCKRLALHFCLPGALGSGDRLVLFLCVVEGGERFWVGCSGEGTKRLAYPQLSFWRASYAHCPLPTPSSLQAQGAELAHLGFLRAFQACAGRLRDFSLTIPVDQ